MSDIIQRSDEWVQDRLGLVGCSRLSDVLAQGKDGMTYYKKKGKPYRRSEAGSIYMNLHPTCEACENWQSEELHHILSRRSGGPDEEWNWLALCKACHLVFHSVGRASFAKRYPWLEDKIKAACEHMGRKFDKE